MNTEAKKIGTNSDLWADFHASLRAFESGEGFDSACQRLACIEEILSLRDELEAAGEPVSSEAKLTAITGDF